MDDHFDAEADALNNRIDRLRPGDLVIQLFPRGPRHAVFVERQTGTHSLIFSEGRLTFIHNGWLQELDETR